MQIRKLIQALLAQEDLNFLLTNRLPRRWLTLTVGRLSALEWPWFKTLAIAVWKFFGDLDLSDAKKSSFTSMHDCFTRELRPGARTIDPAPSVLTSPSDAIIGAHGQIQNGTLFQAKGFPYPLVDLLGSPAEAQPWLNGTFVTLRLTSGMYHRFHAPYDCHVSRVRYFSGDTWNVNPIALKRIERLYCKNERAFIDTELQGPGPLAGMRIALVPVAAILVASIRLHFLDVLLHLRYRGPNDMACDASFLKGQEMGWFQHGSTIIVLAPPGLELVQGLGTGSRIRMGQALLCEATHAQR